jgi:hypothetical protein
MQWNQRNTTKTLRIDADHNNVATMWTIGANKPSAYRKTSKIASAIVLNSESDEKRDDSLSEKSTDEGTEYEEDNFDEFESFQHVGYEQVVIGGSTSTSNKSLKVEDKWQHRFGHMPMSRIQSLASEGVLPKRLSTCDIPVCAGCMYGKLTKQPWRVKNSSSQIAEKVTMPGECVSVDQLYSTVPGLIAQLKGIPTRQRYQLATVFVDHSSDYTFIHYQCSTSSAETLQAKHEFDRHASGAGVSVKRYHADNGRFVEHEDQEPSDYTVRG